MLDDGRLGYAPAPMLRPVLFAVLLGLPLSAQAQEVSSAPADSSAPASDAAAATASTGPASTGPASTGPAEPAAPAEPVVAAAPASSAPSVPPVMVVALGSGRVPPELVEAVRSALVAQLDPLAGGRPVLPLALESLAASFAACGADAACLGGQIAGAGAIGAAIASLSRRGARGPVTLSLDLRDPVSGAPRLPTQTLSLDPAADPATALAPLVAALAPVFFSPPPPPPELLVTVNVDGAEVRIDDALVGRTPLAAQRLTPGPHVVMITALGHSGTRREVSLDPGERERLDVTLAPSAVMDEVIAADGTAGPREPEWYEQWWPWAIVGGVVAVGVGVGIGAGVAASEPPPLPMGIPLPPIR